MELTQRQKQIEGWKKRSYSWSQHSMFRDFSKEDWFDKYILGNPTPTNKRMMFGKAVGERIEKDPTYIPQLPRGMMEYGIEVDMGNIRLVGYMDAYEPVSKTVHEYKTSSPDGWAQKKVDDHGQLTIYALLLMLKENIKPEELSMNLHHMHTEESGDFSIKFASPFTLVSYPTQRATKDVLLMGAEIIKLRKEMEEFAINHE